MSSVGGTGSLAQPPLEIGDELPAVCEPGQGVGGRLLTGQLEKPAVLAERDREADDDERERCRGEHDGEDVQPREVVVDEDSGRDERADGRDGEQRAPLDLSPARVRSFTQAEAAMSSSAVGQRMSIHVPSRYVPSADWKR